MKPKYRVTQYFIPDGLYQDMKAVLPKMEDVPHRVRSHKDIHWNDDLFRQLRSNIAWSDFIKRIYYSRDFWMQQVYRLRPNFDDILFDLDKLEFNPYYVEDRGGREKPLIEDRPFLYPRIDIGYGVENYGADSGGSGPHIDFNQRIVSILWYFTPQKSLRGGEFEVYEGPPDHKLIERIPIAENMAISMLQDQYAWHGVKPVTKASEPRIAVYMALNCAVPIWKHRG